MLNKRGENLPYVSFNNIIIKSTRASHQRSKHVGRNPWFALYVAHIRLTITERETIGKVGTGIKYISTRNNCYMST